MTTQDNKPEEIGTAVPTTFKDMSSTEIAELIGLAQQAETAAREAEAHAAALEAKFAHEAAKADAGRLVLDAEHETDMSASVAAQMIAAWLKSVEDENAVKAKFAEAWGDTFFIERPEQVLPATLAALREDEDHELSITDIVNIAAKAVTLERTVDDLRRENSNLRQANAEMRSYKQQAIDLQDAVDMLKRASLVVNTQYASLLEVAKKGVSAKEFKTWYETHTTSLVEKSLGLAPVPAK